MRIAFGEKENIEAQQSCKAPSDLPVFTWMQTPGHKVHDQCKASHDQVWKKTPMEILPTHGWALPDTHAAIPSQVYLRENTHVNPKASSHKP